MTFAKSKIKSFNSLLDEYECTDLVKLINEKVVNFSGSNYVYLTHKYPKSSEKFAPYHLAEVPFMLINKSEYYTLSKHGLTYWSRTENHFTELDVWLVEYENYCKLRKLNTFRNYRLWKGFKVWEKSIKWNKFYDASRFITNQLFYAQPILNCTLHALNKEYEQLQDLKFVDIAVIQNLNLHSFIDYQMVVYNQLRDSLLITRSKIQGILYETCADAITDQNFYVNQSRTSIKFDCGAKFTERARKEVFLGRLSKFLRLIDYITITMLHKILKNTFWDLSYIFETHNSLGPTMETLQNISDIDVDLEYTRPPGITENPFMIADVKLTLDGIIIDPPRETTLGLMNKLISQIIETIKDVKAFQDDVLFNDLLVTNYVGKVVEECVTVTPDFTHIINTDERLLSDITSISALINIAYDKFDFYIKRFNGIFNNYKLEVNTDPEIIKNERDIVVLSQHCERYYNEMELLKKIRFNCNLGLLKLNQENFRQDVIGLIHNLRTLSFNALPELILLKLNEIDPKAINILSNLMAITEETEDIVNSLYYLDNAPNIFNQVKAEVDYVDKIFKVMGKFEVEDETDVKTRYANTQNLILRVTESLENKLNDKNNIVAKLDISLQNDIMKLLNEVTEIREEIQQDWLLDAESNIVDVQGNLSSVMERIAVLQKQSAEYNKYQEEFEIDETKFEDLDLVLDEVQSRQLLWESFQDWSSASDLWYSTPFQKLNVENIRSLNCKILNNCELLKDKLPENVIIPRIQSKAEDFKEKLPVLTCLRNPTLKRRHWIKFEQVLHRKIALDNNLTLDVFEQLRAFDEHIGAELMVISSQASAEEALEVRLRNVAAMWKEYKLSIQCHDDIHNVFILSNVAELENLLDESRMNIIIVASSPHVDPVRERVAQWTALLNQFSDTLEEWRSCQKAWIRLSAIFAAPDIQRQLPHETQMFLIVDKCWKMRMRDVYDKPLALDSMTDFDIYKTMKENNRLMDIITQCLEAYLEMKRLTFPRLFFLSKNETLEILSQTQKPHSAQAHLRKCFDAIAALEFCAEEDPKTAELVQTNDIIALISPQGERVILDKILTARGPVEDWLAKLEKAMLSTLKQSIASAHDSYSLKDRTLWFRDHPSQSILTVSQQQWAADVHAILDKPNGDDSILAMKIFEEKLSSDLEKLIYIARKENISITLRYILCALITVDVHARDCVRNMAEKGITKSSDFDWLRVFRYYWSPETQTLSEKISLTSISYYYEYVGAAEKLVITPLTDRFYVCAAGVLQNHLGCIVSGGTGTGKSEIIKDFARSIAIQCVVFNGTEALNCRMMSQFFSGLAISGAWCCFDDIDKMQIDILSVVAQQLNIIKNAKLRKMKKILFDSREIPLVMSCSVFITMNPGYAGRTELPDNLKALFRPISMMVPDYALIAEVILYSEGFENSKILAQKMVQMYKLCSEQLSQQDHYDFGMRAVKSVLVMAGALKRASPDQIEDITLICALRDSNLPKFLSDDAGLFKGILADLFPGVELPVVDYGKLQEAIEFCMLEDNLQLVPELISKNIQLYETMAVRWGVMLVGPTGSGKTKVLHSLGKALSKLWEDKVDSVYYRHVRMQTLNPKAISSDELYGAVNLSTMEWKDGLLGLAVRSAVTVVEEEHQWVVCDGPVDAVWIENLNTVLDDNKMLCLANSERIKLTAWVHMVFEVQDLAQASPATVSRCGMVYIDPLELGWLPIVQSWIVTLNDNQLRTEYKDITLDLFKTHYEKILVFARRKCKYSIHQVEVSKLSMLCTLMQSLIKASNVNSVGIRDARAYLHKIFIWCALWSIGGNLMDASRTLLEDVVRKMFTGNDFAQLPEEDLWSYRVNPTSNEWQSWSSIVPNFEFDSNTPFFDMLVPTTDTARFGLVAELLFRESYPVMFTGDTGVGKSVLAKAVLTKLQQFDILPVFLNFSAQTSSIGTQELIEARLERRKKTLLGAPIGKRLIYFVDDVNMPKLDTYGSQPTIELLRQFLDFKGMYDRDKMFWKNIVDVVLGAACAPPGGGRNPLTARFVRHFGLLLLPPPNNLTLAAIFQAIMVGFLADFSAAIRDVSVTLVNASVRIYEQILTKLLPTPAKSHYVFNLRDLSKCFDGLFQMRSADYSAAIQVQRLFYHEVMRVFHDRLVDNDDKLCFKKILDDTCEEVFGIRIAKEDEVILFGDFLMAGLPPDERKYEEVKDLTKLNSVLQEYLDNYNSISGESKCLILFDDAVQHITRIVRLLRFKRGHGLLVGIPGLGKQTLARLAAYMNKQKCFQIELTNEYNNATLLRDVKKLYLSTGVRNISFVFLMTDANIQIEEFLGVINDIIVSGEVPNLFENDEYEKIQVSMRDIAESLKHKDLSRSGVHEFFINRVRNNLHIILCMSVIGDTFRKRFRMFPSLLNCCNIDWFDKWSPEALHAVATGFLSKVIEDEQQCNALSNVCVVMHESAEKKSERFRTEMRRFYYPTPSNFLGILKQYDELLKIRTKNVTMERDRIASGLYKIIETTDLVTVMEDEKENAVPLLEEQQRRVKSILEKLEEDNARADVMRNAVATDEEETQLVKEETEMIANEVERELETGLPALISAQDALKTLNKNEVSDLRLLQKPPKLVQFVLEAICILLGTKTDWASAKTLLADPNFVKRLKDIDKEHIPDVIHRKIRTYVDDPNFNPVMVEKVSKVGKSMCVWVIAIDSYVMIYKNVEPKIRRRDEARNSLNKVISVLKVKQAQLSEIQGILEDLNANLIQQQQQLKDLQMNYNLTSVRLVRARKLVLALREEKNHWQTIVDKLDRDISTVTGDALLSSGVLGYLGAFPKVLRDELLSLWIDICKQNDIPVMTDFKLANILGNTADIKEWHLQCLPKDELSIENAIIVTQSKRWPLVIDPHEQANRWFRKMEHKCGMKIAKFNDPNMMEVLENAIQTGIPVLLEDINENMDVAVMPILAQTTVQRGKTHYLKLGNKEIIYSKKFKLYMTTKLKNPHYSPRICKLINLVHFTVSLSGLEDELLADIVRIEQPGLNKQILDLKKRTNANQEQQTMIEDRILEILQTHEGHLLDEEDLMESLEEIKTASSELSERLEETDANAVTIAELYEKYRPIASHAAMLFSVVDRLPEINPMYQYSLQYFKSIISSVIEVEQTNMEMPQRLQYLLDAVIYSIYSNIVRGIFEKHKLIYSFLLALVVSKHKGDLTDVEFNYLLRGPTNAEVDIIPRPSTLNITESQWLSVLHLQHAFPCFTGLADDLENMITIELDELQIVFQCGQHPDVPPSNDWNSLASFQKLMLIGTLQEEKLVNAIRCYVHCILGKKYTEPPRDSSMSALYQLISPTAPLLFMLTPGSTPITAISRLAQEKFFLEKLHCLSLGEGQDTAAEWLIDKGRKEGHWIFLQNCHLALPWLSTLENKIRDIAYSEIPPHNDYRLFLSSMPVDKFPVGALQNCMKVTSESPRGLRGNLQQGLNNVTANNFDNHLLNSAWKAMVFGICMFHGVILERRKFGALGWNITYEFTESDRECALRTLEMFCPPDKPGKIPWDALEYINGEITYGGRVTDSWDLRCLRTILKTFSSARILADNYKYSETGIYRMPNVKSLEAFREYASALPFVEIPEIFGMHENANLVFQTKETRFYIETLLEGQPRASGGEGASSSDDICLAMIEKIGIFIARTVSTDDVFPELMQVDAKGRVPSLTTVLFQEIERFNRLLGIIHDSLLNLQKAIKGFIVMSENLEDIFNAFLNNQVPSMWNKRGFLSTKPLGNWIIDFQLRLEYMQAWVSRGIPKSSWICGLFFPQSFITGTLQLHARKYNLPIDSLKIDFEVLHPTVVQADIFAKRKKGMREGPELYENLEHPENGINIHGLFIEGGRWDANAGGLCDARLGELTPRLPALCLVPSLKVELGSRYESPMYKTSTRKDTPYHKNFIASVLLPSDIPSEVWILRGTALITMDSE